MGFLDWFKRSENKRLKAQVAELESLLTPELRDIQTLQARTAELQGEYQALQGTITQLQTMLDQLRKEETQKKLDLIQLDDELLYQEFGLYRPMYDFATADRYKDELIKIRQRQKDLIKAKRAVHAPTNWTVNGSKREGQKMINDTVKQMLRTFNTECENAIDRVTFTNIESMKKRIDKSYESLNKLNRTMGIKFEAAYLKLKHQELHLAYEFQQKRQEEKEEQRRIREEMREQARLQKELDDSRKNTLKDLKHFDKALAQVANQLSNDSLSETERLELEAKQQQLAQQVEQLQTDLEAIDYRQANQRAGYVYVISNIGSFGENVFKIGMTRRLEPQDRVDELGDASVPFRFDVHAMIFAEDAPALENALHKAFESKKVNMVNRRREFFYVTLDEVEQVVKSNFDKTVEFTRLASATEYRESIRLRDLMAD